MSTSQQKTSIWVKLQMRRFCGVDVVVLQYLALGIFLPGRRNSSGCLVLTNTNQNSQTHSLPCVTLPWEYIKHWIYLGLELIFSCHFFPVTKQLPETSPSNCLPARSDTWERLSHWFTSAKEDQQITDKCYRCWITPSWKTNTNTCPSSTMK